MSNNQSRAEIRESSQYRKNARQTSFNQHRGGKSSGGGGGSGPPPNPSLSSNRSFNRKYNNAQGGQPRASGENVTPEGNAPSAARAVQNGAHQQHSLGDAPVTSASVPSSSIPTKTAEEATQKVMRSVPVAPSSNVDTTGTDSNAPATPPKAPGDVSRSSFPLQFGSISPGFMNVMQVPARTSSAPPNLDEQKRDQVLRDSSRAVPALPTPSMVSKQPLPRKNTATVDQASSVEAHPVVAWSKREVPVSAPSAVTQSQKPSTHPLPAMHMQMPFHPRPTHPVQFSPQIQSQAMSASPLPIQVQVPLLGNPPLQQTVFVPGFPPHPIPSQGIMHQGQGLNYSSGMSPQMPPQLGNMGMNMPPQFAQQQAGKFGATRIPVKITHPETHEELRLDGSIGARPNHNMPPQPQSLSTFPPTHPNSFNNNFIFFQPSNSLPLNNTQSSQPTRLYSQVIVKSASGVYGEKDQLPVGSPTGKDSQKHSKLHGAASVHQQRDSQISSQSSLPQSKAGDGLMFTSIPAAGKQSTVLLGHSMDSVPSNSSSTQTVFVESSTSVPIVIAEETSVLDSEDWKKKPGYRGPQSMQDQNAKQSSNISVLPSQSPVTRVVEMPSSQGTNVSVETTKESSSMNPTAVDTIESKCKESQTQHSSNPSSAMSLEGDPPMPENSSKNDNEGKMQNSLRQDSNTCEASSEPVSLESSELVNQTEEDSPLRVTNSINYGTSTEITLKTVDDSAIGSSEGHINDNSLSSSISTVNDVKPEDIPLLISALDGHVPSKETAVTISSYGNQDSDSRSSQPCSMTASKGDGHTEDNINTDSLAKEKSLIEQNVQKSTTTRVKKKKKELYKKADAAGATSDLYMAYKGPEEKKETATTAESMDSTTTSTDSSKPVNTQVVQDAPSKKDTLTKVEPDDWEDAADASSPNLESTEVGKQAVGGFKNYGEDGDGIVTKKYSRDFLLKFADQYTDLPEGFEIISDIAEAVMVINANFSRDSYPNPGRVIDRPSSVSRSDRRGNGMSEEDKWNKLRGSAISGRERDLRLDLAYGGNPMGIQPVQGNNHGVLRNPRAPSPIQYAGGILAGPMQSMGAPGGVQRNGVDADRWQRGSGFQKGLMPSPSQIMHKAEKKYEVGKVTDEEEAKQRQLKAILNKLTPQNFEKLFQQVKDVNIDNVTTLTGVISQIFDKALMEPTFCEMYANFCHHLASELPDLSVDNEKITFKRLLLNKCQEEFERGEREEQEANTSDGDGETKLSDEEREEKRLKARRRMLGNIRLIGELYKKRMLTERIMHSCIKKLLGEYQSPHPDEENIEALCKLMSTIGEMIDHPKAKEHMDIYFDLMTNLSNNMKLSSRVRFMLKDSIDLRKNKWQQRRKVEGPKKIEEVHRDAAQERQAQASRMSRAPSMGSSGRRGQPTDFASRGSSMLPSQGSQMGGFRPVSSQMRGFGGQDVRMEDRQHSFDNRTFSVPLPQRSVGDEITLGPQGGLGRGMSFRGHGAAPSMLSTDMPSPGDSRRFSSGPNGYSPVPDRTTYGQREDIVPRYAPDHPGTQERNMPPLRGGLASFTQNVPLDSALPEELLRDKSMNAIREFYSARDENEVALCVKDLNAPSFYPSMVSIWITDSFERKENERDLLGKLIVNLIKSQDVILSQDQLIQGFESVLATLEDAVNDAPKAAEFLGCLFAKVILENVIPLKEIGHLIYEGGEEQGRLREIGLAAEVLGSALEAIKTEKGEAVLNDICRSSNLQLQSFRPLASNKQLKLDKFL